MDPASGHAASIPTRTPPAANRTGTAAAAPSPPRPSDAPTSTVSGHGHTMDTGESPPQIPSRDRRQTRARRDLLLRETDPPTIVNRAGHPLQPPSPKNAARTPSKMLSQSGRQLGVCQRSDRRGARAAAGLPARAGAAGPGGGPGDGDRADAGPVRGLPGRRA